METKKRSIIKSISWRILATMLTLLVAYTFIGELSTAAGLTLTAAALNTILYYAHERSWNLIVWGRKKATAEKDLPFLSP